MPTPNYSNSIIYKLCCKDTDITDIYVGSTTNFRGRKNNHKTNCQNEKRKNYNRKVYKFIREHGDFENWEMIMIEEFSCSTKLELHKKEREYFELLKPNLNTNVPNRTQKQYNIDNKDKKKQYRIDNKDKITEIVSLIPEGWLLDESNTLSPDEMRAAYIEFLVSRLNQIDVLAKEANDAK